MSKPTIYWYVLDVHWSRAPDAAAVMESLGFPVTYNASLSVEETLGAYRLLTATFNPSLESMVLLSLNPKVKARVLTDIDDVMDCTSLGCIQQLSLITKGELRTAIRQQINQLLFI